MELVGGVVVLLAVGVVGGLVGGVVGVLVVLLAVVLLAVGVVSCLVVDQSDIDRIYISDEPNQIIHRSAWGALAIGLSVGLVGGLGVGLFSGLIGWLAVGLVFGPVPGWSSGWAAGWSSGWSSGWSAGWSAGWSCAARWLAIGLSVGLVGGLGVGLFSGLIGWLAVGLVFGPGAGLVFGLGVGLVFGLVFGWLAGLDGALDAGGEACLQHLVLRFLLVRGNSMPLNYIKFLDYATERILLHRVGGGYAFIHQMLLEHFAARAKADLTPANDEAIELDADLALDYYHHGNHWFAKVEYDRAIADYDQAIRLDPRGSQWILAGDNWHLARVYRDRGHAWYAKREYDQAIADYNEAIRLDPDLAWAHYYRSQAWHAKREYDQAIADYNEAIRLDPPGERAHYYRGIAWIQATCPDAKYRDGQRATASATLACKLTDWKDANSLDVLAAACAEAGDFDAAIKWQERVQAMYLDDKGREEGLARLCCTRPTGLIANSRGRPPLNTRDDSRQAGGSRESTPLLFFDRPDGGR